jgi:hypothetical protein
MAKIHGIDHSGGPGGAVWGAITGTLSTQNDLQSALNGKAPSAEGVSNGNSHDHIGGDGAQVDHAGLSNIGATTHAQLDTHLGLTTTAHGGLLPATSFSGLAKITVSTVPPGAPSVGDLWISTAA